MVIVEYVFESDLEGVSKPRIVVEPVLELGESA